MGITNHLSNPKQTFPFNVSRETFYNRKLKHKKSFVEAGDFSFTENSSLLL